MNQTKATPLAAKKYRLRVKNKRDKEVFGQSESIWTTNLAKGLTGLGFTKTFEGQSIEFYLNNTKIVATVDYDITSPHIEFKGEPNVLTETGYRSHFSRIDLKEYKSMQEMVEDTVARLMLAKQQGKKSKKSVIYSLTWEPNLDYLKHSPIQLALFEAVQL